MTQAQFNSRAKDLLDEFSRKAKRMSLDEVRAEFREKKLIYVKKHTVQAYFRRYKY